MSVRLFSIALAETAFTFPSRCDFNEFLSPGARASLVLTLPGALPLQAMKCTSCIDQTAP